MDLKTLAREVLPDRASARLGLSWAVLDLGAELIRHGEFRDASSVLQRALEAGASTSPEEIRKARELLSLCKHIRRTGIREEMLSITELVERIEMIRPGPSDPAEPNGVLVRPHEGASTALIVFVTHTGQFWISLDFLHRALRDQPWHIIYLRDDRACFYLAGVNGLGADYAASVVGLRGLIQALGVDTVHCMGGSAGGYAALRYGLDLRAKGIASLSGPTTLRGWGRTHHKILEPILREAPAMAQDDLLPLYQNASWDRRILLWYGEKQPEDAMMAERMRPVDGVELRPIRNFADHDSISYLAIQGRLGEVVGELAGPPP